MPDLRLGRWCIDCKRYGDGGEPPKEWWEQVLRSCSEELLMPALIYKFNRRPIKVRVLASSINPAIQNKLITVDLLWDDFIEIILELFQKDIQLHEERFQV